MTRPPGRSCKTGRRLEAPCHVGQEFREFDAAAIIEIRADDLDADRQPARRTSDLGGGGRQPVARLRAPAASRVTTALSPALWRSIRCRRLSSSSRLETSPARSPGEVPSPARVYGTGDRRSIRGPVSRPKGCSIPEKTAKFASASSQPRADARSHKSCNIRGARCPAGITRI